MRFQPAIAVVAALVLILAACTRPAGEPTQAQDAAAIDNLRDEFVAVYNAGDAAKVAALYTEDGVVMPPNQPAAAGRQAIESWLRSAFEQFTVELTLSSEEVQLAGDWAFERGAYTIKLTPKAGGEPIEDAGKYVEILQRQPDGSWKIARDVWNSNKPLPGTGG